MVMNKKWLYNPFEYLAGFKALIIGLTVLLLLSLLNHISGNHFPGIAFIRFAKDLPLEYYLMEVFINWGIQSIILYITGAILSESRIRLIDVAGTFAMAKFPYLFFALIRLLPYFSSFYLLSINFAIIIIIHIILTIWVVALLFNAYRISCNLKGTKLILSFIIGLFISEILSIASIAFITPELKLFLN